MIKNEALVAQTMDMSIRFPPSFADNPVTYALALASMASISFISIGILLAWWFEARDLKAIARMPFNMMAAGTRGLRPTLAERFFNNKPLNLFHYHRLIMGGFLVAFILGFLPDTIVMLIWGEASEHSMAGALIFDRIGDAASIVPFMFSVVTGWRCREALVHTLSVRGDYVPPVVSWKMVRDRGRALLIILVMSIGVALYKSQL